MKNKCLSRVSLAVALLASSTLVSAQRTDRLAIEATINRETDVWNKPDTPVAITDCRDNVAEASQLVRLRNSKGTVVSNYNPEAVYGTAGN